MKFSDLKSTLESCNSGGTFTLAADKLGATSIQSVIDTYFPSSKSLVLTSTSLNSTDSEITITGGITLYSIPYTTASIVFSLDTESNPKFKLTITLPTNWSFSQYAPSITGGYLNNFVFSDAKLILQSYTTTSPINLVQGLNFSGTISSGLSSPLSELLPGSVKISGSMSGGADQPILNLWLASPIASIFGSSFSLPKTYAGISTFIASNKLDQGSSPCYQTIQFKSTIPVSGTTLNIDGTYSNIDSTVLIEAKDESLTLSNSLADVFSLINFTPSIPWPKNNNGGSGSSFLNDIYLTNLRLLGTVEPTAALQSFSFGIDVKTDWSFIENKITLKNVMAGVWVDNPLKATERQYGGQISGSFLLGSQSNVEVDLYAQMPPSGSESGWSFFGSTAPGSVIDISNVIKDINNKFSINLPNVLNSFELSNVKVGFATGDTTNIYCYFDLSFEVSGQQIELDAKISITNNGGTYSETATGKLTIGSAEFDVTFSKETDDLSFTATWSDTEDPITLSDIASTFGFTLPTLPAGLDLALESVSLTYDFTKKSINFTATTNYGDATFKAIKNTVTDAWEFYFNIDVSAGNIDLGSKFPVVGSDLSNLVILKDIGLYITSKSVDKFTADYPTLLPGVSLSLTAELDGQAEPAVIVPLYVYKSSKEGLNQTEEFTTLTAIKDKSNPPSQNIQWINFSRTIGPITFKKLGLLPSGESLSIYPDIVLSKSGIELDLDGLCIDISIAELLQEKLDVGFSIDGLGVSYQSDTVQITGQFLKSTDSLGDPEYLGEVIAQFSKFGLSAVGGYIPKSTKTDASFFIYANLNADLGGSPSLFVTGITFGMGLNYQLNPPTIKDLGTYGLLPDYAPSDSDGMAAITNLTKPQANGSPAVLEQKDGENWFAAGVKVISYNMIKGFALVTVSYGVETDIGILGSVSMKLPTNDKNPIGLIELDMSVNFNPASNVLPMIGVVSPQSYLMSSEIQLNGGFAFYIWYAGQYKGDFVFTVGGYYPQFTIPSYYPKVAPLDISFSMGPFKAEGSAYLAITPGAFMAGLRYTASFSFANVKAWYSEGIDFYVKWAPLSYTAHAYVNVGVSVDLALFTVHASIGADAIVWGPPFGGEAHVNLDVVSFTIHFGEKQTTTIPLSWSEFETKFLPSGQSNTTHHTTAFLVEVEDPSSNSKNIEATVSHGQLQKGVSMGTNKTGTVLDPNDFVIDTGVKFPANGATWASDTGTYTVLNNASTTDYSKNNNPEVKSFKGQKPWHTDIYNNPVKTQKLDSTLAISLVDIDNNTQVTRVSITPVYTNSSYALYGDPKKKDDPKNQMVANTLEGFIITPYKNDPFNVREVPLLDLIFQEGNIFPVSYTAAAADSTYKVTITETDIATDISLAITVTKSDVSVKGSPFQNSNFKLSCLTSKWVKDQQSSVLTELQSKFPSEFPADLSLTQMAGTAMYDWPQVQILGA
ncbi:DUF6603 domain-containing protein [Pseudotenacibaculum haliotis]|uniref:DUF6603 domain-containing protein n=1 Tax=Pseudotenacibaculum haliotis TaxID=1862138 RepID=A0ABW5LW31_9FLAO